MVHREFKQARWGEPEVFELNPTSTSRTGYVFIDDEKQVENRLSEILGNDYRPLEDLELPELSELEVVRHYTRLTQQSYGVDTGPVPLGSCTMKYNPKLAGRIINRSNLSVSHPAIIEMEAEQGVLEFIYMLQEWFADITGMDVCSLQPPAGASGELAGVLIMKKYHSEKNDPREYIIVPDSAHGSNPASAAMGGFKVLRVPTGSDGTVDLDALEASISDDVAGMMMTNPNTLGIFEENVTKIAEMIHSVDGLMYYDGANLNGILGIARPGDMGFDIVHLNIHKTFSAPHGSGGPGAGVVCVKHGLSEFLPGIVVTKNKDAYRIERPAKSIGSMQSHYGNLPQLIYSAVFILSYGLKGLQQAALNSVLATNYFMEKIRSLEGISIPFSPHKPRFHEVVLSFKALTEKTGVTVEDISKYLINRGLHAPTIYFPLIVEEAFMIEFTETEPIEYIDAYVDALKEAVKLAHESPDELKKLPKNTSVGRIDHVRANHPTTMEPTKRYARKGKRVGKD